MIDCCVARKGQLGSFVHDAFSAARRLTKHIVVATLIGAGVDPAVMAQVAVSDNGQATYSQAIAVPPGIAGMQPNLSLSYVQGGINGPLGLGWSLQGLSSITRCSANKAIDGHTKPVMFGPTDKLCLDGQRLIQTDESGNPQASVNSVGVPVATQADDARGLVGGYREFRTEKDIYSRIRAYGIAGSSEVNGPAYFKVWTKSGLIYEYGTTPALPADARVLAHGKPNVAVWAVSRMSDVAGNYIDFKYGQRDTAWGTGVSESQAGREWNLVEIQYTGNGTQPPLNKIVFEYEDRPNIANIAQDRAEAYQNGSKNVNIQRLKAIRSYVNWPGPSLGVDRSQNNIPTTPPSTVLRVRTIKLSYDNGPITNRSRLTRIADCAGANESKCLPPVEFTYSAGGNAAFMLSPAFNLSSLKTEALLDANGNYGVLTGDFDGNGLTDILRWGTNPTDNRLWLNTLGSFAENTSFNIKTENLFKADACYYTIAADFNADGMTDLLRLMRQYRAMPEPRESCGLQADIIYLSNGDGTFRSNYVHGIYFGQVLRTAQSLGANYHLIDVNGDGFLDVINSWIPAGDPNSPLDEATCATNVCTRVFLGSASGAFTQLVNTNLTNRSMYADPPVPGFYAASRPPYVADVNGDGLQDLVVNTGVWLSRGDGNFDVDITLPNSGAACAYPIDANDDGRLDCVMVNYNPSLQSLKIADGTYTLKKTVNFNLTDHQLFNYSTSQSVGISVLDKFDGAHSAILRWVDNPALNKLFISNGDGSFREDASFNLKGDAQGLQHSNGQVTYQLGDFAGKGQLGILQMRHGASLASGIFNQLFVRLYPTPPDQLLTVKSSSGSVSTLTYEPLPLSTRYLSDRRSGNASIYPKADLTPPLYVVTRVDTDAGVGTSTIATQYAYAGLKSTHNGRGMLGFREIRQQNTAPNGDPVTVFTRYLQDYPYVGVASYTETRRGALTESSAPRLSATSSRYCEKSVTNVPPDGSFCNSDAKVARPYLLSTIEEGWDLVGTALPIVTTVNTFNNFGDLTKVEVKTTGSMAGTSQEFKKTTTNVFCEPGTANCPNRIDGDNWILGRLLRASVQQEAPNSLPLLLTPTPLALAIVPGSALTLRPAAAGPTSGSVTVNGRGGIAPYTFTWARVSGSRIAVSGTQLATFSTTVTFDENFVESFRVTLTDGAGATATATIDVTAVGPPRPPAISLTPSTYDFGSVRHEVAATQAFAVVNSGGSGTFQVTLASTYVGGYSVGNGTCPANGAAMAASASCTLYVSFTGNGQCGGSPIIRSATLTVAVTSPTGNSRPTAALQARNFVYKWTDPICN